jgi:hypothetical protein
MQCVFAVEHGLLLDALLHESEVDHVWLAVLRSIFICLFRPYLGVKTIFLDHEHALGDVVNHSSSSLDHCSLHVIYLILSLCLEALFADSESLPIENVLPYLILSPLGVLGLRVPGSIDIRDFWFKLFKWQDLLLQETLFKPFNRHSFDAKQCFDSTLSVAYDILHRTSLCFDCPRLQTAYRLLQNWRDFVHNNDLCEEWYYAVSHLGFHQVAELDGQWVKHL